MITDSRTLADFLAERPTAVKFRQTGTPTLVTEDGWQHYKMTLRLIHDGREIVTPWRQGTAHGPTIPDVADVVQSLAQDARGTRVVNGFEEWAGEYGYDTDSRSAERTYEACVSTVGQLWNRYGVDAGCELTEADGVELD
jgi:hypothetical protein